MVPTTPADARSRRLSAEVVAQRAREILHHEGARAITTNRLGRELGVSGPAVYRHFSSVAELVDHVVGIVYAELCDRLDELVALDDGPALLRAARELRTWALANHHEFALLFSSPLVLQDWSETNPAHRGGRRFGTIFLQEFVRQLAAHPRVVERQPPCPPSVRAQVEGYLAWTGVDLPTEGALLFLETWVRIYGHITMEAMGQLSYALSDMEVLYERCLAEIAASIDLRYEPPGPPSASAHLGVTRQ